MSLLTVGTMAFDTVETRYGRAERIIGGACTYNAWAASYFTEDTRIVSIIGEDFPEEELQLLHERGGDTQGVKKIPGGKSFFWEGKYHSDMIGRDTLTTDLNVLADFDPVLPESYRDSAFIMLGNLTPDIQLKVLNQIKGKPALSVLDTMDFWINSARDTLMEVISKVDVLSINDEEARLLTGEHALVTAAARILEMGPSYLIIKKGEHGAFLFSLNDIFFVPGLPLAEVKDPTGAGDTFAGGFIGYLTATEDTSFNNLKRAVVHGSAMASFVVEDFGLNRLRHLNTRLINQRVMRFKDLVSFNL